MKRRCNNPNSTGYEYYGGRGIKHCAGWAEYKNFWRDMGRKPTPEHQLDRIDPEGDYTPENCRWLHRSKQSATRRPWIHKSKQLWTA